DLAACGGKPVSRRGTHARTWYRQCLGESPPGQSIGGDADVRCETGSRSAERRCAGRSPWNLACWLGFYKPMRVSRLSIESILFAFLIGAVGYMFVFVPIRNRRI